jgi:hypothetical protein
MSLWLLGFLNISEYHFSGFLMNDVVRAAKTYSPGERPHDRVDVPSVERWCVRMEMYRKTLPADIGIE